MRILVVDDNRESRESLTDFLCEIGHKATIAENGLNALERLLSDSFDIVISDIRMPKMSGTELLDEIKKNSLLDNIEVILVTAYGDIKNAVEAMKNGAYEYLLKPININELSIIIDKIEKHQSVKKELSETKKELAKMQGLKKTCCFSDKMKKIYAFANKLSQNKDIPILIEGETGTGKEVIAKYIHYKNAKSLTEPFVDINCAALSPSLFESEIFGYEAGTFTGANPKGRIGKIESAGNGTIFFDEIGELATEFQAKLLRIIQEREFYKVGGNKKINIPARIICSTNIDIEKCVNNNTFRKDLFFRLNTGHIKLPPLRERKSDIVPLAKIILEEINPDSSVICLSKDAEKLLRNHSWEGNIRQMKHVLQRVVLLFNVCEIQEAHIKSVLQPIRPNTVSNPVTADIKFDLNEDIILPELRFDINQWNLKIVTKALEKFKWNKSEAAEYLGISRTTLYTYLKKINQ